MENVMLCAGKCFRRVYPLLSHKQESSGWSGLMKTSRTSRNFIINQEGVLLICQSCKHELLISAYFESSF